MCFFVHLLLLFLWRALSCRPLSFNFFCEFERVSIEKKMNNQNLNEEIKNIIVFILKYHNTNIYILYQLTRNYFTHLCCLLEIYKIFNYFFLDASLLINLVVLVFYLLLRNIIGKAKI